MSNTMLIEIGGEGGSIVLTQIDVNGQNLFVLSTAENIFEEMSRSKLVYTNKKEAWDALKTRYRSWYMLCPLYIHKSLNSIVKEDFLNTKGDADDYSRDQWMLKLNSKS